MLSAISAYVAVFVSFGYVAFLCLHFAVVVFVLQKLSTENEMLPDEDLSEEVYYSDEDSDICLPPTDSTTNATYHVENLPNPQPIEVHHDHAALLSQLTSANCPSQATIELAVAELKETLTAEEKQLMMQLVQQMLVMNPVLVATNPLALQVEAIRMILTTRGQVACLLTQPTVQQMALQAQLQNLTHLTQSSASQGAAATVEPTQGASAAMESTQYASAAMEPTGAMAQANSGPVPAAVNLQEDVASEPLYHHMSDQSAQQVPVHRSSYSVMLETDRKYPDDCSSVSSGHAQSAAGLRPPRGRGLGRGRSQSGFQYDDDTYLQDRPRGRGLRRVRAGPSEADEANQLPPGNNSAAVRQPIVPPPLHPAQPVSRSDNFADNPNVNTSEDWEEEIDRFGPGMFRVESSFFRSGMR